MPNPFSKSGTNTYLIGRGPERIILDTGEGKPEWIESIKSILSSESVSVQRCLLSHWHSDHVGGVTDFSGLAAPGASIHKNMPAYKGSNSWQDVHESQRFVVGPDTTLRAVLCPGHTLDHVAFVLEEENAMFTGDNVLGQGTAVFEDLTTYLSSLEKMRHEFNGRVYPGHGPVVEDGNRAISEYISHRQDREDQIIKALEDINDGQSGMSSMDIVKTVYRGFPEDLHLPAQGGVDQVLRKLQKEKRVLHDTGTDRWKLTTSKTI